MRIDWIEPMPSARGDVGALEHALRELLSAVGDPAAERALRAIARAEAERLFVTHALGRQLAHELKAVTGAR